MKTHFIVKCNNLLDKILKFIKFYKKINKCMSLLTQDMKQSSNIYNYFINFLTQKKKKKIYIYIAIWKKKYDRPYKNDLY